MRKTKKPIIIMPLPIIPFGNPPAGEWPPDNGDG